MRSVPRKTSREARRAGRKLLFQSRGGMDARTRADRGEWRRDREAERNMQRLTGKRMSLTGDVVCSRP